MASHLPIVDCMSRTTVLETVRRKFALLRPLLNERLRRHWAACEALTLERGGVTLVAQATGLSRTTITAGLHELKHPQDDAAAELPPERCRHAGAGRHALEQTDPTLVQDLQTLLEANTRGDPQSPLLWTCKSTRNLAEELQGQGHHVSYRTVAALLHDLNYSLQATRRTREGSSHQDRDAQFEHINAQVRACQRAGQPAVSVDAKKKELVGDFANAGHEWQPKGRPPKVRSHDFPDEQLGKVIPQGVYDLTRNEGWVSVGIDHDTARFATGTIKWNKIEHRMFCHITKNWRGQPLLSRAIVVQLIGNTKTKAGLHIQAELDCNTYETGIKVSDEELAAVQLEKEAFHGDWNYTISPK